MEKHLYKQQIIWTGQNGNGTSSYEAYHRHFDLIINGKEVLHCSADTIFRGDGSKYNPEDMFLAALSSCHMLWFLHLCADNGITVLNYTDSPEASLIVIPGKGGHFESATLHPSVTIKEKEKIDRVNAMHQLASEKCFIANSCNFPIACHAITN